jgi:hypothetical protein
MEEKRKNFEFYRFIRKEREKERERVSCFLKGVEMHTHCNGK